jgi:D-alanyl-D-alanine carboxypeptidase
MTERMASRVRFVVLAATLIVASLAFAAVPAAARTAPGRRELRRAVAALVRAGVPGVSVRYQDGPRSFAIDLGTADRRTGRPIRPGLHFRIASETKSFTAVVVLQLVGEGRLSLDDTVERWLPGVASDGTRITVRDLLAMRSGLSDYLAPDPQRVLAPLRDPAFWWRTLDLAQVGVAQPREFPPGTGYAYSNTNYLLLQLIVEKVTGMPFGQELRRRVLRPLRLDATSFPVASRTLPRPSARGYEIKEGAPPRDVTRMSPSIAGAAGAIISTTRDVGRFYRALNAGRLLPPRELDEMRTPLSRLGQAATYGLGAQRRDRRLPVLCAVQPRRPAQRRDAPQRLRRPRWPLRAARQALRRQAGGDRGADLRGRRRAQEGRSDVAAHLRGLEHALDAE